MNCILINYANFHYVNSQKLNTESAKSIGNFKHVINYGPDSIDLAFRSKNARILSSKRIGGYGLWKPYIILKALDELKDGDILFYCDSGAEFISSANPLIDLCFDYNQDIICFETAHKEKAYTKRDAFKLLNADSPYYADTLQRLSGYIVVRKSSFSYSFFNSFLSFAQDERAISDIPNQLGFQNYEGFVDHRHDQSIYSLLCKANNLIAFRDPSQWGNKYHQEYSNSSYKQIIDCSRKSSLSHKIYKKLFSSKRYIRKLLLHVT